MFLFRFREVGSARDVDGAGVPARDTDGAGVPACDVDGAGVPACDVDGAGVPACDTDGAGVPARDVDGAGVPARDVDGEATFNTPEATSFDAVESSSSSSAGPVPSAIVSITTGGWVAGLWPRMLSIASK